MSETQQTTEGQKRARVSFNPSKLPAVDKIKELHAATIDYLCQLRDAATDGEVKAQYTLSIRKLEESSMRAVGAATWHLA